MPKEAIKYALFFIHSKIKKHIKEDKEYPILEQEIRRIFRIVVDRDYEHNKKLWLAMMDIFTMFLQDTAWRFPFQDAICDVDVEKLKMTEEEKKLARSLQRNYKYGNL
jgi:hypothetical protein